MSVNIEDILLLKAQQDAVNRENNGLAVAAGGTLGTALGVLSGQPRHVQGYKSLERSSSKTECPRQLGLVLVWRAAL